jgi:putative transposase
LADTPHDLPPWGIVYHYFWQWRRDGTWKCLNDTLRGDLRVLEGRTRQSSAAIIDSQTVKTTAREGDKGFAAPNRSKGARAISWWTRWGCSSLWW